MLNCPVILHIDDSIFFILQSAGQVSKGLCSNNVVAHSDSSYLRFLFVAAKKGAATTNWWYSSAQ